MQIKFTVTAEDWARYNYYFHSRKSRLVRYVCYAFSLVLLLHAVYSNNKVGIFIAIFLFCYIYYAYEYKAWLRRVKSMLKPSGQDIIFGDFTLSLEDNHLREEKDGFVNIIYYRHIYIKLGAISAISHHPHKEHI